MLPKAILSAAFLASLAAISEAATIQFTPDAGEVTTEGPYQVVTVDPSAVIHFTAGVASAPEALAGYQVNFVASEVGVGELVLDNWTNNPVFGLPVDATLATPGDTLVAAASLFNPVDVPADLGTFRATAPSTPGDYLLTGDSQLGNPTEDTRIFAESAFELPIADYGDTMVRVVPEPGTTGLLLAGALAAVGWFLLRSNPADGRTSEAGRFASS